MPRKIDEAWGEDGFGDIEPVEFEDDQLDRWLGMLGREQTGETRDILQAWLREVGVSLRCGYRRGPQAFSIKQAKAALKTLLEADIVDGPLVMALNNRAEEAITNQLWMMHSARLAAGESVMLDLCADRIDARTLREAARRALSELNRPTGRAREGDVGHAVRTLCERWEAWTGELVTLSNYDGANYTASPTSRSGRWIAEIIKALLPAHSEALVSSKMKSFIVARREP
jgi:hypothetical protein